MLEEPTPAPGRIEVWKTITKSVEIVADPQVLRMPLIGLPILLSIAQAWIGFGLPDSLDNTKDTTEKLTQASLILLKTAPVFVLQTLCYGALSISWQRFLLRGERPSGAYVGSSFWRYQWTLLVVALVTGFGALCLLGSLAILKFGLHAQHVHIVGFIAGGIATLVGAWLLLRLTLKFIAICVDDSRMTWSRSFALMKGSVLALVMGEILLGLIIGFPAGVVNGIIEEIYKHMSGHMSLAATMIWNGLILGILGVLQTLLFSTFNALVYQRLMPGPIVQDMPRG
jgi:hypothetical protein